mmetsp:Transcript_27588/g.31014  ORF Transcript_27588/g.31014 Transcript_27588/m.31014 type:complete len:244 (-) Transcript_27588:71-802(-)
MEWNCCARPSHHSKRTTMPWNNRGVFSQQRRESSTRQKGTFTSFDTTAIPAGVGRRYPALLCSVRYCPSTVLLPYYRTSHRARGVVYAVSTINNSTPLCVCVLHYRISLSVFSCFLSLSLECDCVMGETRRDERESKTRTIYSHNQTLQRGENVTTSNTRVRFDVDRYSTVQSTRRPNRSATCTVTTDRVCLYVCVSHSFSLSLCLSLSLSRNATATATSHSNQQTRHEKGDPSLFGTVEKRR